MWPALPTVRSSWEEIAKAAYQPHVLPEGMEGGLEAHAIFSPGNATWPFGTHIAMVEVDAGHRRRAGSCDTSGWTTAAMSSIR